MDCYKKAIQIDPKLVGAYNNLGLTHNSLNRKELAVNFYKQAIEIEPNGQLPYNNWIVLCSRNQILTQEAQAFFVKMAHIHPNCYA